MKTRLSKLQKWILSKCLEELLVYRDGTRRYFGKKFRENPKYGDIITDYQKEGAKCLERGTGNVNDYDKIVMRNKLGEEWDGYSPKKEICSTRSIEASISRSFGQLVKNELIQKADPFGGYCLTEKGFLMLTKRSHVGTVNTYSGYITAVNRENEKTGEHYKNLFKDLGKIISPKGTPA